MRRGRWSERRRRRGSFVGGIWPKVDDEKGTNEGPLWPSDLSVLIKLLNVGSYKLPKSVVFFGDIRAGVFTYRAVEMGKLSLPESSGDDLQRHPI